MSRAVSGINPLFHGDTAHAASHGSHTPGHDSFGSQSLNPLFKAQRAQREELGVTSSSWQLQGLMADARTTPQEMADLAWNHSTSDSSVVLPAVTAQMGTVTSSDAVAADDDVAVTMAQLLADDRQNSADWVSSSSSSEDVPAPLRSLSFPNLALAGTIRREEVALSKPLGRDTSLPVSVQSGWHADFWGAEEQEPPGPSLRQRFMQEQGSESDSMAPDRDLQQQADLWTALERQPSPVITLRQRFAQAQLAQQQQLAAARQDSGMQGSGMQPLQTVLELAPEDIMLQESGLADQQASPTVLDGSEQTTSVVHQQSGLEPQLDGMSARSAARRQLSKPPTAHFSEPSPDASNKAGQRLDKLPTAMFSEPALSTDESANRGVRFGGAAVSDEEGSWPQLRSVLPRAKSSLKKQHSPQASLRRRSFRRQASSVSFAAVFTGSDSDSDGGSISGKSKPLVSPQGAAGIAAPLVKTVSSVWAMISGGGVKSPVPAQSSAYQPTRTDSCDYDDMPAARPPRSLKGGLNRWQNATKKAVAAAAAERIPGVAVKRPLTQFGSFFDVVKQATAARQPSLSRKLAQEHVEMGVRMLLEARDKGSRLDSAQSGKLQQGSSLQTQQSLAKVMQVLSAKQMSKSVSMASTVQVNIAATVLCSHG